MLERTKEVPSKEGSDTWNSTALPLAWLLKAAGKQSQIKENQLILLLQHHLVTLKKDPSGAGVV